MESKRPTLRQLCYELGVYSRGDITAFRHSREEMFEFLEPRIPRIREWSEEMCSQYAKALRLNAEKVAPAEEADTRAGEMAARVVTAAQHRELRHPNFEVFAHQFNISDHYTTEETLSITPDKPTVSSNALIARKLLELVFENFLTAGVALVTPVLRLHPNHGFPLDLLDNPHWNPFLLLELDPATFDRMHVEFHGDHVSCRLSFDRLYSVEIPYAAVAQVAFTFPVAAPTPTKKQRPSGLRLVSNDEEEN